MLYGAMACANPVDDLLDRIGGKGACKRFVTAIEPTADGKEYFTIDSENGQPKITGDSYLSVATGIHWYLKYYAGIFLAWNNLSTDLTTAALPVPAAKETRSTLLRHRYYLNYCTYSYSMAFWNWSRWEQEIDWMALHGVNMPLALVGTEVVWRNILMKRLGYSKAEVNEFVAGPGFQAWFLMNNLEGWGGPNPDAWYEQQEVLQKRIVARMRELGMQPVLAGYSGMVPHDVGRRMGWQISDPGTWCGFQRPGFLLPTDEHFDQMAKYYYDEMRELYGVSRYYSMDPFHEGGNIAGVGLTEAFRAIYRVLKTHSGYAGTPQWVVQSWQENPRREALDALEPGTLIVLDLSSDARRKWSDTDAYRQTGSERRHEFVYCVLNNFGGRTGMHGRLQRILKDFYEAQARYPQSMTGVGATMEGIENNPVVYEMTYELAWRPTEIAANDWIKGYAKYRYGSANAEAEQAWQLLSNSIYNCPTNQDGVSESVLCARPSLTVRSVSTWSTAAIYYDTGDVRKAAQLLLSQSDVLSGANYTYDLVDVVRQSLSDYANELLQQINAAHTSGATSVRNSLMDRFLELILDQDKLMSTVPDFMLGRWIESARKLGTTSAEKDLYEQNARLQISTWGPLAAANAGGLHDYSNREWGGLLKDYYYKRWKVYFDSLRTGTAIPDADAFFRMEYEWANTPTSTHPYPSTSKHDPVETAKEVFSKYCTEE